LNPLIKRLYNHSQLDYEILNDPEVAHLIIHHNKVLGLKSLEGLEVSTEELTDGVKIDILLKEGVKITKPVHLCFGMLINQGIQRIYLNFAGEKFSSIQILSHCTFPNAENIKHIMEGKIELKEGAEFSYFERHVHGLHGGIEVYPHTRVVLHRKAKFKTEFELLRGRVGIIDIDYEITGDERSSMDMITRINGYGEDKIKIKEVGYLKGKYSTGVLRSRIAVRDKAKAEVYNKLIAYAAYARGHVDCKEIIQDEGIATAVPIVEVRNPKAHITHEAAIGSVDSKQLQTLMARGLTEEEAVELIIKGLLS